MMNSLTGPRRFLRSILFNISILFVVVLMTGILVILGLSVVNRLQPGLNKTDFFRGPDLSMSNGPAKSNKDANVSGVQKLL